MDINANNGVSERIIARVENMISYGLSTEEIHAKLTIDDKLSEYDAFLAFQAGRVSLEMFTREYVEQK